MRGDSEWRKTIGKLPRNVASARINRNRYDGQSQTTLRGGSLSLVVLLGAGSTLALDST